jgi:hypothetical protein
LTGAVDGGWVEQAARNNAAWCDAVCAAHGLATSFDDRVWSCPTRTPALYPDAVTLRATASADDVLSHIDVTTPGCSVKDSFASLDLSADGFRVLFDATWIACGRVTDASPIDDTWSRVGDPAALDRWKCAADRDLPEALLHRDDIVIVAGRGPHAEDGIIAGGILNCSGSVVGISNVFTSTGDLDGVWSACLAFAGNHFPGAPLVGYEAGAPLAAARRHGFEPMGRLQVWIDAKMAA